MNGLEVNILDKIFRRLFYYSCGFVFWLPFKGIRRYYLRLFVHSIGKDIYVGRNNNIKIGILTQPLHANYGGLLQNYALQQVLLRAGHEVETRDFLTLRSIKKRDLRVNS